MATVESDRMLAVGFSGELLRPGDDGYDEARRVHNGLVDKRPGLIARCQGVADVVAAVNHAREAGAEVSVRGCGHNVAGLAVTEGGVMIDLSAMRGIHVDPANRTGRVQPGVTWGELNRETQLHGLAVTGGTISTTGIAGLTLGGGVGWLMSKYGIAADNLISADVVLADGSTVTASEDDHSDLLWGLRGGGGNFGVVTSFEFRLHQVGPIVTGGIAIHPFQDAVNVLRFFREQAVTAPDELTTFGALLHAPDGSGGKLAAIVVCHIGDDATAQRDLADLISLGTPIDVQIGPMPYSVVNTLLDAGFPRGALNYWKSSFLNELSDAAIDTVVEQFANCVTSPMSAIGFEYFHGQATRVPVDATAVPHRGKGFNCLIVGEWMNPDTTAANIAWARETYTAMEPFTTNQLRYVNYLDEDDMADAAHTAYGPNHNRLTQLKTTYDPHNLFHLNANIKPR
jgi:FAD/FMN-containing dehydrogenase